MMECKHAIDTIQNSIDEKLCFCELNDEWKNVVLGECLGNCEAQESEVAE